MHCYARQFLPTWGRLSHCPTMDAGRAGPFRPSIPSPWKDQPVQRPASLQGRAARGRRGPQQKRQNSGRRAKLSGGGWNLGGCGPRTRTSSPFSWAARTATTPAKPAEPTFPAAPKHIRGTGGYSLSLLLVLLWVYRAGSGGWHAAGAVLRFLPCRDLSSVTI